MTSPSLSTEHYDLCLVGAGITGLNALFSATRYLRSDQRVLLLDRNDRPGGMWVHTYDYVRLHQPHPFFTAGNIPWRWDRPPEYLATKAEVLDHFAHCLDVLDAKVRLDARFGTTFESAVEADDRVHVTYREADGAATTIRADRLIKAIAADVPAMEPLQLTSTTVRSVSPEECDVRTLPDDGAPVWIVGSGKTAVDTACALIRTDPSRSVTMIAGSGTWFNDRDLLYPPGLRRWISPRPNQLFTDLARRFDGTNERAVADWALRTCGVRVTAGTGNFLAGLVSRAERDLVVGGLDTVVPGHLTDVLEIDGTPTAVIDGTDRIAMAPGTWVVNCTGHFREASRPAGWDVPAEPYASASGAIVSVTSRSWTTHFGSFGGYYLPHLAYRDLLGEVPLYAIDLFDIFRRAPHLAIYAMVPLALHNLGLLSDALPARVFMDCGLDFDRWVPLPRQLVGTARFMAAKRRDREHHRRTLDTLARRLDITCGPLPQLGGTGG